MSTRRERVRRAGWWTILGVASLLTVLCVGLVFAAIRDDHSIEGQLGTATATVDSVAFDRTIIHFSTPDGIVHSPSNGVLYPSGLSAGQLVRIEYDAVDPDLARVAGRSATLTLLPLGSTVFFTWLVAAPLLWWLRRPRRRTPASSASDAAAPPDTDAPSDIDAPSDTEKPAEATPTAS